MRIGNSDRVLLSHGAGGRAMIELIEKVFFAAFGTEAKPADDSAVIKLAQHFDVAQCDVRIAFTTDSFVVDPLFFPGGDIGRLAVAGTVNDLLTAAARPIALSASFIIEEGLEIDVLDRAARSMRATADECGVEIVTGDTKVVPRGSADKLFVTTAGIGAVLRQGVSGANAKPGDKVILTGSIGDHGTAVMLAREGLLDAAHVTSDAAPLTEIVLGLLDAGCKTHAMRDPTRGGIAAALNEIASQSQIAIEIDEESVPVKPGVAAACEALGLDPFQVANEGKMLIFIASNDADRALQIVRRAKYGDEAAIIGKALEAPPGRVQVRTAIGTARLLDMPAGELLPRIC